MHSFLTINFVRQIVRIIALGSTCVATTLPSVVAKFGGECSGPTTITSKSMRHLIERKRQQLTSVCQDSSCNEAFSFDLNSDGKIEHFVRLSCGGTGNCIWGIYAENPVRQIGQFEAWFFYIHKRGASWSLLSTYTREGAEQGVITRLAFRRKAYRQISERTERGDYYDHQPFLTKMGIPKCS